MPYDLMHVAGSGSVPSWLGQSTLAPFVADALQLERLLRALASTAAWHFSHAGAPRHATCFASLAASYFFRMVRLYSTIAHKFMRAVHSVMPANAVV